MFNFRTAYGHVAGWVRSRGRTQCYITNARLSSLSAMFWWGVIGTTNKTIHGARVWIRPGVSSVRSYPRACLLPTGTDLVRFTWFAVKARRYLRVNDLGLHKVK